MPASTSPQSRQEVHLLFFILVFPPFHVSQLFFTELGLSQLTSLGIIPLLQPLLKGLALNSAGESITPCVLPEKETMLRLKKCFHRWVCQDFQTA